TQKQRLADRGHPKRRQIEANRSGTLGAPARAERSSLKGLAVRILRLRHGGLAGGARGRLGPGNTRRRGLSSRRSCGYRYAGGRPKRVGRSKRLFELPQESTHITTSRPRTGLRLLMWTGRVHGVLRCLAQPASGLKISRQPRGTLNEEFVRGRQKDAF